MPCNVRASTFVKVVRVRMVVYLRSKHRTLFLSDSTNIVRTSLDYYN